VKGASTLRPCTFCPRILCLQTFSQSPSPPPPQKTSRAHGVSLIIRPKFLVPVVRRHSGKVRKTYSRTHVVPWLKKGKKRNKQFFCIEQVHYCNCHWGIKTKKCMHGTRHSFGQLLLQEDYSSLHHRREKKLV
jgi:hypothetical protein